MSDKLDAIAYRNRVDYRLRRLEETLLLLATVTKKTFYDPELQNIYDRHINELRGEINNNK